jgi:hypothetical protein
MKESSTSAPLASVSGTITRIAFRDKATAVAVGIATTLGISTVSIQACSLEKQGGSA